MEVYDVFIKGSLRFTTISTPFDSSGCCLIFGVVKVMIPRKTEGVGEGEFEGVREGEFDRT